MPTKDEPSAAAATPATGETAPAPAAARGRGRSSVVVAVVMAIGVAAWIGSGLVDGPWAPAAPEAETETETTAAETPVVDAGSALIPVRVRDIRAESRDRVVTLFGRTDAIKDAEIQAETAGRVIERPVKKGAWVTKGTVILRLALDDRGARHARAKARVAYERVSHNAAVRLKQKQFQSRIRLAEAAAKLAEAEAELAEIELDIRRTRITAPIDGYLDFLPLGPGDYVTAGAHVATVVDLDPIRVVGRIAERDVGHLEPGSTAVGRLPDGREITGTVRFVSRMGSDTARTFRVDVWFDNPDARIADGLTVALRLPAGRETAHLVSPATLTLDDRGVLGVKLVGSGDQVAFHPVRLIDDTPEGMWIGGLPAEARLITVGQEFVTAGQKVEPVPEESIARRAGTDPS